jgi:hypothetical protein
MVPYFACVIADENNNRWVHKTFKELKEGDELVFESNSGADAVAIWRIKYDHLDAIEKVSDLMAGILLNENSKVLVLPTLISANQAYLRDNTSPAFLAGVLDFLASRNVKLENIKIATQSFSELPAEAMAQRSGLLDVCLKNKIMPTDLSKSDFTKQGNLEIADVVMEADIVLNLSMLKAGRAATIENSFRVLKKENYMGLKYLNSEREIADELIKSLPNLVNLGEAEYLQASDGFIVFLGAILASKNPMMMDRVLNEILMEKSLPKIIADMDIGQITIAGREIRELQFDINKV